MNNTLLSSNENTEQKSRKNHINRELQEAIYSPIIEGYFPQSRTYDEEMAITKVNRILFILLGILIIASFISYYQVTSSQMTLNKIRKEIIALNNENFDLQNKLDNLKSFNNVDRTMKKSNLFKAKNVIEVQETTPAKSDVALDLVNEKKSFKRSLGY